MHPMLKYLIHQITDDKPINWSMVHQELKLITISEREKALCKHLEIVEKILIVHKEEGEKI